MRMERRREVSLFDVVNENSAKQAGVNSSFSSEQSVASISQAINRWTGRPYLACYFEILKKRKTPPVWQQKDEFLQALNANQTPILVGEIGSGKTTQRRLCISCDLSAIGLLGDVQECMPQVLQLYDDPTSTFTRFGPSDCTITFCIGSSTRFGQGQQINSRPPTCNRMGKHLQKAFESYAEESAMVWAKRKGCSMGKDP